MVVVPVPSRNRDVRTLLATIVESSDDAILSKTLDGVVTRWNPAAVRLSWHTPDEIIGQSISILVPPERQEELQTILSEIRAGRRVDHHGTQRIRKDGAHL